MIADLKRRPEIWRLPPQPGDELLGEASLIEEKNDAAWGMTWGGGREGGRAVSGSGEEDKCRDGRFGVED